MISVTNFRFFFIKFQVHSKIQTSFNAKNHHHNQRHLGAPSIDFSWHIWIFGLPDSLGTFFIKWKIFLNLFQKTYILQKKIFSSDTALPKWLPVGQGNLTLTSLYSTIQPWGPRPFIIPNDTDTHCGKNMFSRGLNKKVDRQPCRMYRS